MNSNEFKVNAIQLSHIVGFTIKSVAKKLNIPPFMLSRWRKECRKEIVVADKLINTFITCEIPSSPKI